MPAPVHTLSALLARQAGARPEDPAFIADGVTVSYGAFARQVAEAAAWLQVQGIGPGDRVAIWLPNRVEWLVLLFAVARLGAVAMTVNTRYRAAELAHALGRSHARVLVMQPRVRRIDFAALLRDLDPALVPDLDMIVTLDAPDGGDVLFPGRRTVPFAPVAGAPPPPDRAAPDLPCLYFTTSGTTKGPKLVVHPQRTLAFHSDRVGERWGFDQPGACMLAMLPFCGVFGLNGALAAFASGAPVVLLDVFDAARAADLIIAHAVTHTFGSDEMFRRLLAVRGEATPFPSCRVFGFAAFQPGAADLAQEARRRGMPMTGLYGSSEVMALFALQPEHLPYDERIRGGGSPSAGAQAQVRIRDIDSGTLLPAGASGEIEIFSPANFVGYLDNPEATTEALLPDGFFRTGDIGHLRSDGSFVYDMRKGDAIRLGGFLVTPGEIEDVLKGFPELEDVQVVAVMLDGGYRPVAFAVPAPGAEAVSPAMVLARAADLMAPFKVPIRLWLVDAFPATQSANGTKIQKVALRAMAEDRLRAEAPRPAAP